MRLTSTGSIYPLARGGDNARPLVRIHKGNWVALVALVALVAPFCFPPCATSLKRSGPGGMRCDVMRLL